jgi:hypothetical protein
LNLYYQFGDKVLNKLGIERLRVAFNMNELGKISTIRVERGTVYPFSRTMSLSLSATF